MEQGLPTTATTTVIAPKGEETFHLPPPAEWPHLPVLVTLSHNLHPKDLWRGDGQRLFAPIPLNTLQEVPFSTSLFEGKLVLNVNGVNPPPPRSPEGGFFTGCEGRTLECVIQGRFKRRLRFDEVVTGQYFHRPLTQLPANWLLRAVQSVMARIAPALKLDVACSTPHSMGPLAAIAPVISIHKPEEGESFPLLATTENTKLLGGAFAGAAPMERMARKRYFSDPHHLTEFYYEPHLVYSFGFFGNTWNVQTCKLDIGVTQIDMASYLNGQPPQVMAKLFHSHEYLWALDVWHTNLLPALGQHEHEEAEGEEVRTRNRSEKGLFSLWGSRSPKASGF